jgi:hypothetical protein
MASRISLDAGQLFISLAMKILKLQIQTILSNAPNVADKKNLKLF